MAAKSVLFLACFLLLNAGASRCETAPEKSAEPVQAAVEEQNSGTAADQPDPYKNITWDSVTGKDQGQTQTTTVYSPGTRGGPDFVSVSSTGSGANVNSGVVVAAPSGRRPRKWFFW